MCGERTRRTKSSPEKQTAVPDGLAVLFCREFLMPNGEYHELRYDRQRSGELPARIAEHLRALGTAAEDVRQHEVTGAEVIGHVAPFHAHAWGNASLKDQAFAFILRAVSTLRQ